MGQVFFRSMFFKPLQKVGDYGLENIQLSTNSGMQLTQVSGLQNTPFLNISKCLLVVCRCFVFGWVNTHRKVDEEF